MREINGASAAKYEVLYPLQSGTTATTTPPPPDWQFVKLDERLQPFLIVCGKVLSFGEQ